MSASRFLSPKVGEFMRLSRNIISIFVDFLPPGMGGGMKAARLYGNSTFLRKHRTISVTESRLGVFVKKQRLVRSPFSPGHEFYVSSKSHRKIYLFILPSCLASFGVNKKEE